jgi:methylmalonyl-CoA mutase
VEQSYLHSVEQPNDFTFPAQTVQKWEEAALKELEAGNSLQKIMVKKSGLTLKPYFTKEDQSANLLQSLTASTNPYLGARSWHNTPKVVVENADQANQEALAHLQAGADGVCFDLKERKIKAEQLLDQIELPYCLITFLANQNSFPFLESFHAFAEKKFNKATLTGNIFWEGEPDYQVVKKFSEWGQFQARGVVIESHADATKEIAAGLTKAVNFLDQCKGQGIEIENAFHQIAFSVSVGNDFFVELAKLKALRFLWQQVEGVYKIKNHKPLFIQAGSTPWVNKAYQPHSNLIKETYSAMSAILGGCDALTIEPEDFTNATMVRMARNASSVLREESFLSQVADPLAGSYFVDSLTQKMAEKAWERFQSLEME